MAIVDMKRLLLAADNTHRDALLTQLQRYGCVQVTPFEEEVAAAADRAAGADAAASRVEQAVARARWTITKLGKYDTQKSSMLSARPEASVTQLAPLQAEREDMEALVERVEALERRAGEIRGQETRLKSQLEQMAPWEALDIRPQDIQNGRNWVQYVGTISRAALEQLRDEWAGKPVYIEEVSRQQETVYFWAVAYSGQADAFHAALKEKEYTAAQFEGFEGTVAQHREALNRQVAALADERAKLDGEYAESAKSLPALRIYHDALATELNRVRAGQQLLHTSRTFLLRGWVPETAAPALTAALQKDFPGTLVDITDPEPGDEPPVLLKNNRFATPFEGVVEGFSLPAYGSLDPTAVMAPFFACFFGMMVSDAGYGLMMMILVPLLLRLMKPTKSGRKLFLMIGIGGVFTVFWGFFYNTWFGFAPLQNPILDPINRPLEVMALCIGVGAIHLVAGLVMGAVQHIRRGEYIDVLYDQVSWLMLLVGLGLLVVPGLANVGKWLAIAGAAIVIIFAGRDKGNNPFKRLISGLGALYGISSWLSDLLSYLRLFGMGLATGVIGMVFNILIGMVFGMGPIGWVLGAVLFVGCHLFNAGINILGAYVHASRLQYIEFFGKFYEEGGMPFRPLSYDLRYVRISDA